MGVQLLYCRYYSINRINSPSTFNRWYAVGSSHQVYVHLVCCFFLLQRKDVCMKCQTDRSHDHGLQGRI